MDIQTIISVLGLLGIGGIIGSYLQHLWNQKRDTALRIQELNENKYRSLLVQMRCYLKPDSLKHFVMNDKKIYSLKNDKAVKEYVKETLIELYNNSLLYASDEVLIKIKQFMNQPSESNFMKTAVVMRKDLWKKGTKLDLKTLSLQ